MNTLERLERWRGLHKSHACSIEHDDGYGASDWIVSLFGHGKIEVAPGSLSDLKSCKEIALRDDAGKYPDESVIAGYHCYERGNGYTFVIGKDGGDATLEDLLRVALTYMEDLYEKSKGM